MPPASAASATCGESQCTCGSTPPGVTTMPVASITAVAGSSATIGPPATPTLVQRTPSTGSATSPPTIASSTPPRSARTPSPSRIVLPKPGRIRSGPPASSDSGTSQRSESASRTASGTEVPPLARELERRLERAGRVEGPVGEPAVAADHAGSSERGEPHLARYRRVEEQLLTGGDGEPHAPRSLPLEVERAVDLEEVEVRRDAYGHVAFVDDGELDRGGEPLDRGLVRCRRLAGIDRVVQDEQPAAAGEQRLDLDTADQPGDAPRPVPPPP